MPRYFAPCTKEELADLILDTASKNPNVDATDIPDINNPDFAMKIKYVEDKAHWLGLDTLTSKVEKDLKKVDFDTENLDAEGFTLTGFQTLDNGFTFLGIHAGGDWEQPIFFIIYWDGKELRGYIPEDGNVYNTKTKTAFGNDDITDAENLAVRFGIDKNDASAVQDCLDKLDHDAEKLEADIKARILPSGSSAAAAPAQAPKAIKASVPSSQQASLNKTILETSLLEIESMQSNLESMKKALTNVLNNL
jgi:hypothetical protein